MAIARLVDVEVFKLRKRTLTWILLAVLIALIVLVYVLLWAVTETLASSATGGTSTLGDIQITNIENIRETIYLRQAVPFGLEMTRAIGLFLAVILAAACVGSEYDWYTIRPYLTATRTRAEYMQGKIIAVALLVLAGTAAGMVTALLTSAVITEIAGSSDYSFVDTGYIGDSVLSYGRTLLAIAPYVAMATLLATWGRSTMAGIAGTLGFVFVESIIASLLQLAGEFPARLSNALPSVNADTVMLANNLETTLRMQESSPLDVPLLSAPLAALVLLAYTVGTLTAAFVLFQRRDVHA